MPAKSTQVRDWCFTRNCAILPVQKTRTKEDIFESLRTPDPRHQSFRCGISYSLRRVFFRQPDCRRTGSWRRRVGSGDDGESLTADSVGADPWCGAACFKPEPRRFKLASNVGVDCGAVFNRLDHRRCSRGSVCRRAAEIFAANRYRGFYSCFDLGAKVPECFHRQS